MEASIIKSSVFEKKKAGAFLTCFFILFETVVVVEAVVSALLW
jgi:hypothetical protein